MGNRETSDEIRNTRVLLRTVQYPWVLHKEFTYLLIYYIWKLSVGTKRVGSRTSTIGRCDLPRTKPFGRVPEVPTDFLGPKAQRD